ncbi:MAG: polysaccharide deacetylase family protein [Atopobiaceae bacterium]|nr:polysaccharide deacetylase family protein [Atopobiaceae bacterium]
MASGYNNTRNDDPYLDDGGQERRRRSSTRRSADETRRSSTRRSSASRRDSSRRSSDGSQRSTSERRRASEGSQRSSRQRSSSSTRKRVSPLNFTDPRADSRSTQRRRKSAGTRTTAKRRTAKAQKAASRRSVNPISGISAGFNGFLDRFGLREPSGMPSKTVFIAAGVFTLVFVLALHHFLRLGITVNSKRYTVWRGTTIEKLLDAGYADPEPTPGDLLAVDGSVLEKGGGDRCSATINEEKAKLDSKVPRGANVLISNGEDTTEKATVTEETIPYTTSDDSREFDNYWAGAIHLLSDGEDGVQKVTTGTKSGIKVTEVVTPAKPAGYSVYSVKTDDKVVALTFDDGPWEETTKQILDILEENGAKATFFTIGNQISEHTEDVKRADQMGCEVCTHSWDHAAGAGQGVNLTYMSSQEQIDEIQKGYAAIKEALGTEPVHIIRTPGGNFYGSIVDTLWPYVDAEIGWDLDTEDWRLPGSDAIYEVLMEVQPGQIVLMHDGGGDRSQTVEALREALPKLKEQGYSFITMSELLNYGMPGDSSSSDSSDSSDDSSSSSSSSSVNEVG